MDAVSVLVSLAITIVGYGVFPLFFVLAQKAAITQKKFKRDCYIANFFMFIFIRLSLGGTLNLFPYLLWTWLFSSLGLQTLKKKGLIESTTPKDLNKTDADETVTSNAQISDNTIIQDADNIEATPKQTKSIYAQMKTPQTLAESLPQSQPSAIIQYCRKCGTKLNADSIFCHSCGTKVIKE